MKADYYSTNDEIKILKKEKECIEKEIKKSCHNIDNEKKSIKSKRKKMREIDAKLEILKNEN